MRAPFQILAIPYRERGGELQYCVLRRSDMDVWQFVAGGGEAGESPAEAAVREIAEETGVRDAALLPLTSMCYIRSDIFKNDGWPEDLYVIPEYSFGFCCKTPLTLSPEHTERRWLPFAEAYWLLRYDSNRTALYELGCRLTAAKQTDFTSK